jgi:hypothetical protein
VPFDAAARSGLAKVTDAIERSGVAVEPTIRDGSGIHIQLEDDSWY